MTAYTLEGRNIPDDLKAFAEEMKDPEFAAAVGHLLSTGRRCGTAWKLRAVLEQQGITLGNSAARAVMRLVEEVFWKKEPARDSATSPTGLPATAEAPSSEEAPPRTH